MKALSLLAVSLFTSALFAMTSLPDGKWAGKGHWSDSKGNKGDYTTDLSIEKNTVTSHYQFGDKKMAIAGNVKFDNKGFIAIYTPSKTIVKNGKTYTIPGRKVGGGYCLDVWCHYEMSMTAPCHGRDGAPCKECGDDCKCGDDCQCGDSCDCGDKHNCPCGDNCQCGDDCDCGDHGKQAKHGKKHHHKKHACGQKVTLEETVVFVDGNVYRLGSKMVKGAKMIWSEELAKN